MRKYLLIVFFLFVTLVFTACDYPEKSFQALNRDEIPKEVTRDFTLPKGHFGTFEWTSNSDALLINGNIVTVNQKIEDTDVIVTARVNNKTESFMIKVLKIGSDLSFREKAEDLAIYLNDNYKEINDDLLELPNYMNGLYIEYVLNRLDAEYGFKVYNGSTFLTNSFRSRGNTLSILVNFFSDKDMKNLEYYSYLNLTNKKMSLDSPYYKVIEEININKYTISTNLNDFNIYNLKVGDIISFGKSELYDVKLTLNNDEYFKKINETTYEIIKGFRKNIEEFGRLTITIDNIPKTIYIHLYMKKD